MDKAGDSIERELRRLHDPKSYTQSWEFCHFAAVHVIEILDAKDATIETLRKEHGREIQQNGLLRYDRDAARATVEAQAKENKALFRRVREQEESRDAFTAERESNRATIEAQAAELEQIAADYQDLGAESCKAQERLEQDRDTLCTELRQAQIDRDDWTATAAVNADEADTLRAEVAEREQFDKAQEAYVESLKRTIDTLQSALIEKEKS